MNITEQALEIILEFQRHIKVCGRGRMCAICTRLARAASQQTEAALAFQRKRPPVVVLCGSTKFYKAFQEENMRLTLKGKVVLSIGAAMHSDDEHFRDMSIDAIAHLKDLLDGLHLWKIDMADEVLCLNVGGYIGESTRRELAYAMATAKPIQWLEPDKAQDPVPNCGVCGVRLNLTFVGNRVPRFHCSKCNPMKKVVPTE